MAKTLHVDGTTGKVYIYNSAVAPSTYATPTVSQLPDLHFHSDLSYLGSTQVITATVSHPTRTRSSSSSKFGGTHYNPIQGTQTYTLGTHSFGAVKPFVAFYDDAQLPSGTVIQQNGQSVRAVSVYVDSAGVKLFENYTTFDDTLAGVSRSYTVYLFETLFTGAGNTSIQIEPGLFKAGFGKLSTDYHYLRRQSSSPDFYVGSGATADAQGGGLKIVLADGTTAHTSGTYTGSFTGTTGTGVDI